MSLWDPLKSLFKMMPDLQSKELPCRAHQSSRDLQLLFSKLSHRNLDLLAHDQLLFSIITPTIVRLANLSSRHPLSLPLIDSLSPLHVNSNSSEQLAISPLLGGTPPKAHSSSIAPSDHRFRLLSRILCVAWCCHKPRLDRWRFSDIDKITLRSLPNHVLHSQ